jgi:hypothetical protein
MTIAYFNYEAAGSRVGPPEGPFGAAGQTPLPSFKPGTVGSGDSEAEFVYLLLPVYTSRTLNQGDFLVWDNTYCAQVLSDFFVATGYAVGSDVGTFYLGGRSGDPAAWPNAGNMWSYTFTPGLYGIWVQRAGTSLGNWGTITSQATPAVNTATPGQAASVAVASHAQLIAGLASTTPGRTFTGTTVTGSAIITGIAAMATLGTGIEIGMTLSGAGIPNGAVVIDFQGNTLTMNVAATASASVTITATKGTTFITTVNLSPIVTAPTINGLYPNALLTAVGVAGGAATIVSISGNAAPFQITLSGNSTASATVTATASKYIETYLRWPYVSAVAG